MSRSLTDGSAVPLLDNGLNDQNRTNLQNSVLLRTLAFGINGFFFAAHLVLNGKYLSLLDSEGGAASALMSTYQSVILGSGVGFLLATGLDFGTAVGKREFQKAGDVAKAATALSLVFGVISATLMLSSRATFPLLFHDKTAKIASDFFTGYAVSSLPILFSIVAPQIAFQEGEWYIPPATMFSLLVTSGIASYLLGFTAELGALGVGLGGTIGGVITACALMAWSFRENYGKYKFHSCEVDEFSKKTRSLLSSGWKLALQRLTEWGNLLLITTILGARSNDDLKAINPAMLYLVLFGTAQQGLAQAAGMVIAKNKGAIQKAIQDNNSILIEENHLHNIKTIFRSNVFGVILNSVIALSFYLRSKSLSKLFLSDEDSQEIQPLAENLLWITMLGLVPDACRIIGAGALRGWKDLLYPTIISFVCMTLLGVPAGYGLSVALNYDAAKMMVILRNFAMLVAAVFILKKCYDDIKKDEKTELAHHLFNPPGFFRAGLSLVRCPMVNSAPIVSMQSINPGT